MTQIKTALIVDDDATLRLVARKHLKKMGFEVVEALTGLEAVSKCKERDFDLILMDIQMPDMDGLEATRIIRELQEARGGVTSVIIAITASQDRERAKNIGMSDFLFKPFVFATFKAVIENWFPGYSPAEDPNSHS